MTNNQKRTELLETWNQLKTKIKRQNEELAQEKDWWDK
jgi:hypothetical protein